MKYWSCVVYDGTYTCSVKTREVTLWHVGPFQLEKQVIRNVLHENLPISEEEGRKLIQNKDARVNLALPDIPYKTKKQTLAQEGSVLSNLGFLML